MKKISVLALVFFASLSVSAFANQIKTGEKASCNNASTITIEVAKVANTADGIGFTTNDRGTGNVRVWKSSNFTTVPITLGPNDSNHTTKEHDNTGTPDLGEMGRGKVVLTKQEAFSRGDSIGDIGGLVEVTNTGTNPVSVTCN